MMQVVPFVLLLFVHRLKAQNDKSNLPMEHITEDCYQCVCEAVHVQPVSCATNFNCSMIPINKGCGPYLISYDYWRWIGSPSLPWKKYKNAIEAWRGCAEHRECARAVVKFASYKNIQDCNGDGKINCDDFIKIYLFYQDCDKHEKDDLDIIKRYNVCRKRFVS